MLAIKLLFILSAFSAFSLGHLQITVYVSRIPFPVPTHFSNDVYFKEYRIKKISKIARITEEAINKTKRICLFLNSLFCVNKTSSCFSVHSIAVKNEADQPVRDRH